MPIITVDMFEGRTAEQKKMLARRMTEAFTSVTGARPDSVQIVFREVAKENWACAGELCSDCNPWAPADACEAPAP